MNITVYSQKATSTAIYPVEAKFSYPALGLCGELGETIDKLTFEGHSKAEIIKELGDIIWYVNATATDVRLSLADIAKVMTVGVPTNFTEWGAQLRYGNDSRSALVKLPIYAGRIAEIAKKVIRDGTDLEDTKFLGKRGVIKDSLCHIMVCLFAVCDEWSINMDDVAKTNIDKLFSRKERGVLKGSGDNR